MPEMTWQDHVELAEHHLALGHEEVYLSKDEIDLMPWHLADSAEPGGGHRLEMATSVWFRGTHPETGLRFRWSFDIEPHDANGKGHYVIDTKRVQDVMSRLSPAMRKGFAQYLAKAALSVRKNADKYAEIAKDEYGTAAVLERLSKVS